MRSGVISAADVERGLSDARASGLRLVSALVRLGKLSADDGARALADHHGVPAALSKHLDGRDLALAPHLTASVARELCALPIALSRNQESLVVCVRDPSPAVAATLARAAGKPIVLAVAVEAVLAPLVAEAYPPDDDAAADDDFDVDLDSGVTELPPDLRREDSSPFRIGELQLVDLDDHGVSKDHSQVGMTTPALPSRGEGPRRNTGPFAAIVPDAVLELPAARTPVPRLPSEPAIIHAPSPSPSTTPPPEPRKLSLDAAIVAITRAETRDFVIESIVAFLRLRFDAGVIFSVKDGLALGQAGFGGDLDDDAITALTVPLSQKSVLRAAHERKAPFVGAPTETGVVQDRFFKLLGTTPVSVVVQPVVIKDRVINLIFAHGARSTEARAAEELRTLATAAEDAYVRIIREAKES